MGCGSGDPVSETGDLSSLFPFETVPDDLPCLGCGYNLKTLPTSGVCPECARDVATSIRRSLIYANREWLVTVRQGTWWLLAGTVLFLVATGIEIIAVPSQGSGLCLVFPVFVCYSGGLFAAASREPTSSDPDGWLRPTVQVWPGVFGFLILLTFMVTVPVLSVGVLWVFILTVLAAYWGPLLVAIQLWQLCKRSLDREAKGGFRLFVITWVMSIAAFLILFPLGSCFGWVLPWPVAQVRGKIQLVSLSAAAIGHAWFLLKVRRVLRRAINRETS